MNTRVVAAYILGDLDEQIDQPAEHLDHAKGWIVKHVLISWVELEAERRQLTLEGLTDVDAGRLVDHVSIDAWAKSLTSNRIIAS